MQLSIEQQVELSNIDIQIKQTELHVHYWLTMASTGEAKRLKRYRRNSEDIMEQLTETELQSEALQTAATHIHVLSKLGRNRALVLENRLDELEA